MSDFYNTHEHRVARKAHKCTYCAEPINTGGEYEHQTGVFKGRWFTVKMHPECWEDLVDNSDGEYTPYRSERPELIGGAA